MTNKSIIISSPYHEPTKHWQTVTNTSHSELQNGRRVAMHYGENDKEKELNLVNRIRPLVKKWREEAMRGKGGVSRTTMELLKHWHSEGRKHKLFFTQLEAAETIIFLTEASSDYLQGIDIPLDEVGEFKKRDGFTAFSRWCCKMATGSGKTTVMAMLAAWSILNKIADSSNKKYCDSVLIICPNVTIREQLGELQPQRDKNSIYRTRDLVPQELMLNLRKGKVLTINWHVLEAQSVAAKVVRTGRRVMMKETIYYDYGKETNKQKGKRYMTPEDLRYKEKLNACRVIRDSEKKDEKGNAQSVKIESEKYIEGDIALVQRLLRDFGNKQNILVMNDEAHHAYRLHEYEDDDGQIEFLDDEDAYEEYIKEATVWVDGLDKIHKHRTISRCLDFSATPYFLGKAGKNSGRIFPWVVSDFSLSDAIESGLVKIPQLPAGDSAGDNDYYDLWDWVKGKMKSEGFGEMNTQASLAVVLKYAHTPIAIMAGEWEKKRKEWEKDSTEERPPVFIIVCNNVKKKKIVHEWIAGKKIPQGMAPFEIESLRNTNGKINTIRIDSKVSKEMNSGKSKNDETRWMRFTLATIGKTVWQQEGQENPTCSPEFEALAKKLNRAKTPPGRDVRCIVSVNMLTEGWDCNTVTNIIGLRPFTSQLLCEQVVGRGLRRANYEINIDGYLDEEYAYIFGVPFDLAPIKVPPTDPKPKATQNRIFAVPDKADYEISFPRVERYHHEIRERLIVDIDKLPIVNINLHQIPPAVNMVASNMNKGTPSLVGKMSKIDLENYRRENRLQKLQFKMTLQLALKYANKCSIPQLMLFQQLLKIVKQYFDSGKISAEPPSHIKDAFMSPYYGNIMAHLNNGIRPDTAAGESVELPCYDGLGNGSTADVDFNSRRDIIKVNKSHLNAIATDSKLEARAVFCLDNNKQVKAFVKNEGLNFAILYERDSEMHEYRPDFIVRLQNDEHLILETKGFDKNEDIKKAAASRWVDAVNADGQHGKWHYELVREATEINNKITAILRKE